RADITSDIVDRYSPITIVLLLYAIYRLTQADALIAIRSKYRSPPPLVFSSSVTRCAAKYGNLIGVPLLLIAAGIARLVRRRRTTRRVYRPLAAEGAAA